MTYVYGPILAYLSLGIITTISAYFWLSYREKKGEGYLHPPEDFGDVASGVILWPFVIWLMIEDYRDK